MILFCEITKTCGGKELLWMSSVVRACWDCFLKQVPRQGGTECKTVTHLVTGCMYSKTTVATICVRMKEKKVSRQSCRSW